MGICSCKKNDNDIEKEIENDEVKEILNQNLIKSIIISNVDNKENKNSSIVSNYNLNFDLYNTQETPKNLYQNNATDLFNTAESEVANLDGNQQQTLKKKEIFSKIPTKHSESDEEKSGNKKFSKDQRKKKKGMDMNKKDKQDEDDLNEKVNLTIIFNKNSNFEDPKLIEKGMNRHFFLKNLERLTKKEIIKRMFLCFVKKGQQIMEEGITGTYFYIIKKGEVKCHSNNRSVEKILRESESFGELGLIHKTERQFSVTAITDVYLWVLDRKTFKKITDHVNKLQYEENKNLIESIYVLKTLDNEQKNLLSQNFVKDYYEMGSFICKKGENSSCLYIVKEGEVNCTLDGKSIKVLKKGDLFEEKSILIDSKRNLDYSAKTYCIILSLTTNVLKNIMGSDYRDKIFKNFVKSAIFESEHMKKIDFRSIDKIYNHFRISNFKSGQEVFRTGYPVNTKLVVVVDGNLITSTTKEVVCTSKKILFEKEVFYNVEKFLEYSIIANPDCLLVEIEISTLTNELGGSLDTLTMKSGLISCLQKVSVFKTLTHNKIEGISKVLFEETFQNGHNIVVQGEEGDKFYIIKSGMVDIFVNGNFIRTLNDYEYFGERALLLNEARKATCTANGKVTCFVLDKKNFKDKIDNNLKDFLNSRILLQDTTLQLTDLEYVKDLGHGSFGDVYLCYCKKHKYYYALKSIKKCQIDDEKLHSSIEQEKKILMSIDHPFIVKCVKILKDSKRIFFLMEFIKGKELFEIMAELGILNSYEIKYFTCSILSAIEYLHKINLIYRDIKPENILVNDVGIIKLIDFGTCKKIDERTKTVIGTPHYMAPEVIMGEGYTSIIDLWSIGICIYEFSCGTVPFGEEAEEPVDVYLSILNDELRFPSTLKDENLKDLLKKMLCKTSSTRLCSVQLVYEHQYFSDFNIEELLSLSLKPAYIPKKNDLHNVNRIPLKKYLENLSNDSYYHSSSISPSLQQEYDKWFEEF